jgi:general secretion pathway protein K
MPREMRGRDGSRRGRGGYALLAVLWVSVGVAALGIAIAGAARDAVARSRNRVALAQAEWLARGCMAETQARAEEAVAKLAVGVDGRMSADAWIRLDSVLAPTPAWDPACTVTTRPAGAGLDVNAAPDSLVAAVLLSAGVPAGQADSVAAALADWRDADDDPRPAGAERGWYQARGMDPPPNRPFVDRRELALVRGVGSAPWRELLDVEGTAISLHHAPPAVLAALPGFGPEAVAHVAALRRTQRLQHYQFIADGLDPRASVAFMDALPRLITLVTLEPASWTVRVEAAAGTPAVRAAAEMRLVRQGAEMRVIQQRTVSP